MPFTRGMILDPGATLRTGPRGRAVLKRDKESLALSSGTTITLPVDENRNGRTVVHQLKGQVKYKVRKRDVKHFSVDTPFLTAVVKGTQFTVSVGSDSSEISVRRGIVEVGDYDTGQFAQLRRGHIAQTRNQRRAGLQLRGRDVGTVQQRAPTSSPAARAARELARQQRADNANGGAVIPGQRTQQASSASGQDGSDEASTTFNPTAGFRGFGFSREAQSDTASVNPGANNNDTATDLTRGRDDHADRARDAAFSRGLPAVSIGSGNGDGVGDIPPGLGGTAPPVQEITPPDTPAPPPAGGGGRTT
ncbi:MAG: FecR family protein [Pseudomonadota bacterium]